MEASARRAGMAAGRVLRHWRSVRRISQMDLAMQAGISPRHLSFVETGRSSPSRSVILQLAGALDLSLRDTNNLLEAAGYARVYGERNLSAPEMAQMRSVVEFVLAKHEPYGAIAMDKHWNVILANGAHYRILDQLLGDHDLPEHVTSNMLRLVMHPEALRPRIVNWEEVALVVRERLRRETVGTQDAELRHILSEVEMYPGVSALAAKTTDEPIADLLIPVHVRLRGVDLRFLSAVTTVGAPQDITLQELRIETFFPADEQTEAFVQQVSESLS